MTMIFKLGRNRPIAIGPRLSLANYMRPALPAPPAEVFYGPKAHPALKRMYLNDRLGCCVEAEMFHTVDVLEANAGRQMAFTDAQVEKLYEVTGYRPGQPQTDRGSDEQSMLSYWSQKGLDGAGAHKVAGWVALDGSNQQQVMTAVWLFENVMTGVELPDAYVNPFPQADNFVWDVAGPSVPSNGHSFLIMGYGPHGVRISTWGMVGTWTWPAVAKYLGKAMQGEAYTVLSTDAIAKATGKAPNGFDFATLTANLKAIGQ